MCQDHGGNKNAYLLHQSGFFLRALIRSIVCGIEGAPSICRRMISESGEYGILYSQSLWMEVVSLGSYVSSGYTLHRRFALNGWWTDVAILIPENKLWLFLWALL